MGVRYRREMLVTPSHIRTALLLAEIQVKVGPRWIDVEHYADLHGSSVFVLWAHGPLQPCDSKEAERRTEELLLAIGEFEQLPKVANIGLGSIMTMAGWAVTGLQQHLVKSLAYQFGQDAILKVTRTNRRIYGCFSKWEDSLALDARHDEITSTGLTLTSAISRTLGVSIDTKSVDGSEPGWLHDGDPRLSCPTCREDLHLFEVSVASRSRIPHRSLATVCTGERIAWDVKDLPTPHQAVAERWADFSLASRDADALGLDEREYWAYVIEAFPRPGEDTLAKSEIYVGQTSKTPEIRLEEHKTGIRAAPSIKGRASHLREELYKDQPVLRTAAESLTYESWLFSYLEASGHRVVGGH